MASFFSASRKRLGLTFTILITSLGLSLALVSLRVQHVVCHLDAQVCPEELTQELTEIQGTWLFFPKKNLEHSLHQVSPYYQLARYQIQLPGTLEIYVQKQVPAYQVRQQLGTETKVIAEDGAVMTEPPRTDIPNFILLPQLWEDFWSGSEPNHLYHAKFQAATQTLKQASPSIRAVYLLDRETLVLYLSNGLVVLTNIDELALDLQRLDLVLKNMSLTPQPNVQEIDVRFQFPVLRESISVPRHEAL